MGTCSNTIIHENYQTHEAECCLPPGEYTLECKDSYGDGWHGGFITINEINYCENFNSSSLETHEVLIGSDTEPEGKSKYNMTQINARKRFQGDNFFNLKLS